MKTFLFRGRFDFFLKSNFNIIDGPQLFLRLVIFNLLKSLRADHNSFSCNNLLHSPLKNFTDGDEVDYGGSVEPTIFRSCGGNSQKHTHNNKHENDDCKGESEAPHHHFISYCTFCFIKSLEEVNHEVPCLKEELLAGNVGWPSKDKEAEGDRKDND